MYRKDVSKGPVGNICERNVCTTRGTSENYIGLRPKVRGSILGGLYSKTREPNSDFNGILFINRQTDGETELDIKIILITLC